MDTMDEITNLLDKYLFLYDDFNHEKKVIIECSKSGYVVFEKQDVKILCSVEKK